MYAPNIAEQLATIRSRAEAWERQLQEIEAKIAELESQRAKIKESLAAANQALSRFQGSQTRS